MRNRVQISSKLTQSESSRENTVASSLKFHPYKTFAMSHGLSTFVAVTGYHAQKCITFI